MKKADILMGARRLTAAGVLITAVVLSSLPWLGVSSGSNRVTAEEVVTQDVISVRAGSVQALSSAGNVNEVSEIPDIVDTVSISMTKLNKDEVEEESTKIAPNIDYEMTNTGWVSAKEGLNIRSDWSKNSEKLGKLQYAAKIKYASTSNNNWLAIEMDGVNEYGYVWAEYVTDENPMGAGITYKCSGDSRKSYMSWRAITAVNSPQYKLQARHGYTLSNGIRACAGRYCIAIGQSYGAPVGTFVDVTLADGTVLNCIVADAKANHDTIGGAGWVGGDGGIVEFVVETPQLPTSVKISGSISSIAGLGSPVIGITVYPYVKLI